MRYRNVRPLTARRQPPGDGGTAPCFSCSVGSNDKFCVRCGAKLAWVPALTTGIVTWCFHRYFGAGIGMITFLGLHTIIWVFNLVGNLRHWQAWLSYGPTLNRWLISPARHQALKFPREST